MTPQISDLKVLKTVLVVYSNRELNEVDVMRLKKYSFNTLADLKIGDRLASDDYDTKMQVVKVFDESFKYYNSSTGELSNNFNSTSQWDIRELVIQDAKQSLVVYATLEKKTSEDL